MNEETTISIGLLVAIITSFVLPLGGLIVSVWIRLNLKVQKLEVQVENLQSRHIDAANSNEKAVQEIKNDIKDLKNLLLEFLMKKRNGTVD